MSWTDDRVELLTKLWADGLSASQIAAELGGVTRNAVIGKVHRLKLSGRAKPSSTAKRVKKTTATAAAPNRAAQKPSGGGGHSHSGGSGSRVQTNVVGATALQAEYDMDAIAREDKRPQEEVVIPISRKLKLVQLSEYTCKWPVGDPINDEDFHFCGNDVDESKPYCQAHCKLAFQPSAERRRAR